MKRQLIAFLSLFSLVVVLSIYYVTLPNVKVNKEDVRKENVAVSGTLESASNVYFESLLLARDDYYKGLINNQTDILVSSSFSNLDKENALNMITNLNNQQSIEKELRTLLYNSNYPLSYVEINDDYIKVIAEVPSYSKEDVVNIMSIIDTYYDTNVKTVVEIHAS